MTRLGIAEESPGDFRLISSLVDRLVVSEGEPTIETSSPLETSASTTTPPSGDSDAPVRRQERLSGPPFIEGVQPLQGEAMSASNSTREISHRDIVKAFVGGTGATIVSTDLLQITDHNDIPYGLHWKRFQLAPKQLRTYLSW